MNARPLPPSCGYCGGEGATQDDELHWSTCSRCAGTGEAPARPLPAGIIAVACLTAALLGSLIPSGWFLS